MSYMVVEGSVTVIWNGEEQKRLDTPTDTWQTIQLGPYETPRWSFVGLGVLSFIRPSADRFQSNQRQPARVFGAYDGGFDGRGGVQI